MVTVVRALTFRVVIVNVAFLVPFFTFTEPGTRAALVLLLVSVTVVAADTFRLNNTVPVADFFPFTALGLTVTEISVVTTCAVKFWPMLFAPLSVTERLEGEKP